MVVMNELYFRMGNVARMANFQKVGIIRRIFVKQQRCFLHHHVVDMEDLEILKTVKVGHKAVDRNLISGTNPR